MVAALWWALGGFAAGVAVMILLLCVWAACVVAGEYDDENPDYYGR